MRIFRLLAFVASMSLVFVLSTSPLANAQCYRTPTLVSDQAGAAPHCDPALSNAWGLSISPTGPWWVSDEATGVSTLYNASGVPQSLIVTIPSARGGTRKGSPTGTVFDG